MIKIAIHSPNFSDGTSFYRVQGPLSELRKEGGIDVCFFSKWDAASISLADILFLQRPYSADAVQVAQLAKLVGVKIWMDTDDDTTAVGTSHPFAYLYNSFDTKANVRSCLALADKVTVSTEHLKTVMQDLCKTADITVIPNAVNFNIPFVKSSGVYREGARNNTVLYRGSSSHEKDVLEVAVELIDALREFPTFRFDARGYLPWFVVDPLPQTQWSFTPWCEPHIYFQKLIESRALVVVHPLENVKFNLSKSNCSWLESTLAGCVFITRNLPEFQRPGAVLYDTPEQFKELLVQTLRGEHSQKPKESLEYIREHCSLEKANLLRKELIYGLASR